MAQPADVLRVGWIDFPFLANPVARLWNKLPLGDNKHGGGFDATPFSVNEFVGMISQGRLGGQSSTKAGPAWLARAVRTSPPKTEGWYLVEITDGTSVSWSAPAKRSGDGAFGRAMTIE